MKAELRQTVPIYGLPSQSLWRAFELKKLRELKGQISFHPPILEIGCGDGAFSALVFEAINDGIDINPRVVQRCGQTHNIYRRLRCMDARFMDFPPSSYQTVFANCVIEHIADLESVVRACYRVLGSGGKFIATVPLTEMNKYLSFRGRWYAELRRRQLAHVNLLTQEEWNEVFQKAGFDKVQLYPYLAGKDCRLWDILDSPCCIGSGRYRLSAVLRLAIRALPAYSRVRVHERVAVWLADRVAKPGDMAPCAVAVIAEKTHCGEAE